MVDTETDTEPEENDKPHEPEKRRIYLASRDQVVEVEGPDGLDEIAKLAAYFWLLVSPPNKAQLGFTAGSTLITERGEPLETE